MLQCMDVENLVPKHKIQTAPFIHTGTKSCLFTPVNLYKLSGQFSSFACSPISCAPLLPLTYATIYVLSPTAATFCQNH